MKQSKSTESPKTPSRLRPGLSPQADENQCISLAMDIAKQKLLDGTASNTMIIHFLKLGTSRERLERELMEKDMELKDAKIQPLESQARIESLYIDAMKAMRLYSGYGEEDNNVSQP